VSLRRGLDALPLAVLLAAALALGWTWLVHDELRQDQYVWTLIIIAAAAFVLLLWFVFFSLSSPGARWGALCAVAAATGASFALLRVESVSGDLVPRFVWRWAPPEDALLPPIRPSAGGTEGAAQAQEADSHSTTDRDYPRFLGADATGVVPDVFLELDWTAHPPQELWRQPIGAGWSSFAVAGGFALTQEQRGEEELVVCYELESGKAVWAHADRARFEEVIAGVGPRATPTVDRGRVYTLGATGILNCLEGANGARVWSVDTVAVSGGEHHSWGQSSSPLLWDDLVLVTGAKSPEGHLLAFHRDDGERVWAAPGGPPSYASPFLATLAGREQVVLLGQDRVAGHDPRSGALLWEHPWPGEHPKVTQPVVIGSDRLLVTSGYGVGCELLRIERGPQDGGLRAVSVWKNLNLKSKFANAVVAGGFAYGLDDGILVCLDLATGERQWKAGRYGHGQLLLVGDVLLVMTESKGDIVLVDPNPEALVELARHRVLKGRTWNHPVVSGPYLLVRNASEAACYRLALRSR
jgi:outer membrane protein assembly factor BamB